MRISLSLFSTPKKRYLNNGGTLSRNSQERWTPLSSYFGEGQRSQPSRLSRPPPITTTYLGGLLESWLHLGPPSPQCHFCHWISCRLQPCIPRLLFSAHVLTLNCLENRKGVEAAMKKKKKIDQGPGKLHKKKMPLNVSYATISIPLTHFFWRRHSSAHRSGYSCLETIAGVLLRQLLSYCEADAFFSRQSI